MAFETKTLYVLRNEYECGNCATYTRTIKPSDFPSTAIPNYSKLTNVKVHFEWRSNVAINATANLIINGTQVGSNKTGTGWKNFDVESLQGYFNSQKKDTFRPIGNFVLKMSGTYRNWWVRNWYITYEYYTPVFTITLPSDSTQGSYSGAGTYDVGTSATITATPKYGYRFVKWSDGNTSATRTVTVTQDDISAYETSRSYTAIFELDKINKVYVGTSQPKSIYVGTSEVKAVYVGTNKVYG